ncbi:unnamed protein product [Microthlaspi erraticum]|uniref:NAF domain-containing protein n=1 Tax=Microthlaspi erraticum TaxID=1685480 RepID=A0A6D2J6B9_9BRAS|nr:unnamed protein product [Microthlaspi erraticum]
MLDPNPETRITIARIRECSWNRKGLFGDVYDKQESRFTSEKPAYVIISKLEEVAQRLKLSKRKREADLFKLESLKEGRKGVMLKDAEIFQVMPTFQMVETKKSNGDTLEYQKLVIEDLRPALADIVWVWQSDKDEQDEQLLPTSKQETEQHEELLSILNFEYIYIFFVCVCLVAFEHNAH